MRRDQGRIENMVVEENFMDLLRAEDGSETTAERLNCADKGIRGRADANMLCVTSLLNRLIRPTPARKEIRLLKINLVIEAETQEIQQRGAEIIEAVEQKVVAQRKEQEAAKAASGDGTGGGEESLTAEEEQMGVQIHRIAVRVAGRIRNIPYKVMPEADDASKFVIVEKDPENGEMVPVRRRGQKRYVQRGRDGWELA